MAFSASVGWHDPAWAYRKPISISASNVAGPLTNFPVLISHNDSDLRVRALASGDDLVFTSSDGTTRLAHEIESYSNGLVAAWVKVPYLATSSNTVLYLYYGNAATTNPPSPSSVWDANYNAVWHLKESGNGSAREYKDSTAKARHSRGRGGIPVATPGKIGDGQSFNGTSDYIEGESTIGITGNSPRTVSFWVKLTSASGSAIAGWGTANDNDSFVAGTYANYWALAGINLGNDWLGIAPASTGIWQHHTIVHNGSTVRWYLNGTEIGNGFNHNYATADSKVLLGTTTYWGTTFFLKGLLDEVRISNLARSTNWIHTEYANQNSPATFYTVGAEERPVTKANSALALSVSANPVATGTSAVLTAVVTAIAPAAGPLDGPVQFRSSGSRLGDAVPLVDGIARLTNSTLAHGAHLITAEYLGNDYFVGCTNQLSSAFVINTAPVAGVDRLGRYASSGSKIRITDLLTNDSDADGDVISFLAFAAKATNGGTIASNSGWLIYSPIPGFTGDDSFSYVIADSGALQSTGVVTITTATNPVATSNLVKSETLASGDCHVRLRGIPGRTYTMEYSAKPETLGWQPVTRLTANSRGELDFTAPPQPNTAERFYRITIP